MVMLTDRVVLLWCCCFYQLSFHYTARLFITHTHTHTHTTSRPQVFHWEKKKVST